jgi:hypothetical protein
MVAGQQSLIGGVSPPVVCAPICCAAVHALPQYSYASTCCAAAARCTHCSSTHVRPLAVQQSRGTHCSSTHVRQCTIMPSRQGLQRSNCDLQVTSYAVPVFAACTSLTLTHWCAVAAAQ